MSWIIAARYVHRPRTARCCDECGRRLGPHIYLYGRAHDTDSPNALRLCLTHLGATADTKIRAALAAATRRAPNNEEPIP